MGIPCSIPCDPCINKVFNWLDEKVARTHNLKKNLVALEKTIEELKAKRDDLSRRLTREEDRGLQRLAEFQVWLTRVETIENEVKDLLVARIVQLQKLCLCGFCSKSFISSYRYGKTVFLKLREVEKLKNEAFDVIADQAQTSQVQEKQLQPTIVGQEIMLEKAWKHLTENEVGIMGLYGMGGVGKTTLLKQINNRFTVKWYSPLVPIWEKVDLVEIGIPFPTKQNRCKVVFTTRSQEVCAHMGVKDVCGHMEVQCLGENEAFDLFQKNVGEITLGSDPEIPNLARIVAKKCCGLPLALNVIGETMSCKKTIQEWHHAIYVLNSYAIEFSGMEDKILPILKYSYDSIKGDHVKSCLLYCALFPEDDNIPKERLIDYWICEGIIDGSGGIERAENKGYEIIGSLVRASLLMEGIEDSICMHDVVREMALWIASDLGIEKEAFIARAGVGLNEMPKVKNWNVVRRMSLMKNKIDHLVGEPECLELTTLLLQAMKLANISSEFFKSMPKLVVLDLSGNRNLCVLPEEISELVSLQYLNLSSTGLRHLPKGLQELKELIHLDLEYTTSLSSITGISGLHSLRVLKLSHCLFTWDDDTVEELKTLEHLQVLTLGINRPFPLGKFFSSHRLTSCTFSLTISNMNLKSSWIVFPATMDKLCHFFIRNFFISEIKMVSPQHNLKNLSTVFIDKCKGLKELTLLMFIVNLKDLHVDNAKDLEDIINQEKASESEVSGIVPFPKLISLRLYGLPKLKNIYWSPLPLPCLKEIYVRQCPKLKKLPLDSKSGMQGENGLLIEYEEKEWIKGVEWEDEATKLHFLPSCHHVSIQI